MTLHMKPWIKIVAGVLGLVAALAARAATAPTFELVLNRAGNPQASSMNLIITAEGYAASDKAKFLADAQAVIDSLANKEPWKTYVSHINFYTSWVVSNQSGISVAAGSTVLSGSGFVVSPGTTVDTAFKGVYDGTKFLTLSIDSGIEAAYEAALPIIGKQLFILNLSTANAGVSGVGSALITRGTDLGYNKTWLCLHELGHLVGGLGDEDGYSMSVELGQGGTYPNISLSATNLPWATWIDSATPVPTADSYGNPGGADTELASWYSVVGAFHDSGYNGYRPTYQSIMRGGNEYGPVNSEALVLAFYKDVGPLISVAPNASTATIRAGQEQQFFAATWASPSTITTTWYLDGTQLSTNTSVTLKADTMTAGAHTLKVAVKDTTTFVRNDPKGLLSDEYTWAITAGNVPVFTTQPVNVTVIAGQSASFSVVVDAGGAAVSYQWKKGGQAISGATGSTYTITGTTTADAGSYSVTATTSAGNATSNAVTLTVTPAPSSSSSSSSSSGGGGGGGGGGAAGVWYLSGLASVFMVRVIRLSRKK